MTGNPTDDPLPPGLPARAELPDPEPEPATAHGRIGYGRYGRLTPLALAILMVLGLVVIGIVQWRSSSEPSPPRPGQLPGTAAPAVELTLLDGTPIALADQRGSVVVMNFWASWCEPCRNEMPVLQALHEEAAASGERTVVLGVGIRTDQDADARAFVKRLGLTYPIGRDTATDEPGIGPIERAFGITNLYPSTVIIRPDGTIDRLALGELTADQLRLAVDQARANSAPLPNEPSTGLTLESVVDMRSGQVSNRHRRHGGHIRRRGAALLLPWPCGPQSRSSTRLSSCARREQKPLGRCRSSQENWQQLATIF